MHFELATVSCRFNDDEWNLVLSFVAGMTGCSIEFPVAVFEGHLAPDAVIRVFGDGYSPDA
jgi:hypothetical protein